jgi:hypothetical protein
MICPVYGLVGLLLLVTSACRRRPADMLRTRCGAGGLQRVPPAAAPAWRAPSGNPAESGRPSRESRRQLSRESGGSPSGIRRQPGPESRRQPGRNPAVARPGSPAAARPGSPARNPGGRNPAVARSGVPAAARPGIRSQSGRSPAQSGPEPAAIRRPSGRNPRESADPRRLARAYARRPVPGSRI